MNDIKLSICCITYNHEKYLKEALEGILLQKVDFDYEVIISDDCSTDNSQSIIKSYLPLFKQRVKTFLGTKNIGAIDNYDRAQLCSEGEYVIVLETDDKWTDPYKLQKQVDYLDSHPEVIAVAHKCKVIDKNSKVINIKYPECKSKVYTLKEYKKWIMPGQTTTIMYRNYHVRDLGIDSIFIKECSQKGPGDRAKVFSLLANGEIHCLPDCMSEYRLIKNEGSSFSATNTLTYINYIDYFKIFVDYAKKNLKMNYIDVANSMYVEAIFAACFLSREINIKKLRELLHEVKRKKVYLYVVQYLLHLLKNKIIGVITNNEYL